MDKFYMLGLAALIEQSGLTAKDFMARMVATYETNQMRPKVRFNYRWLKNRKNP